MTVLCAFVFKGADVTDPGTETEESLGASDSTQRPADSQTPSRKIQEKPVKPIAHMQNPPHTLHIRSQAVSPPRYLSDASAMTGN